jgi:hypothetical protein
MEAVGEEKIQELIVEALERSGDTPAKGDEGGEASKKKYKCPSKKGGIWTNLQRKTPSVSLKHADDGWDKLSNRCVVDSSEVRGWMTAVGSATLSESSSRLLRCEGCTCGRLG